MRNVHIPRILHELHGEEAAVIDLVVAYLVAIAAAVFVVLRPSARPAAIEWWEIAIAAIIAGDLAGGVVANFSHGTDRYYAERPRLRVVFILLHVVQPTLLFLVIGGSIMSWVVIPVYAIVAALVVNFIPRPAQLTVAAALTAVGVFVGLTFFTITPPIFWFTPIFLVKLVLGFAVVRTV